MPSLTAIDPRLVERARAHQIATLFTQWPLATASMLLGALILSAAMWGSAPPAAFGAWLLAITLNQAWRLALVRRYRAAAPPPAQRKRWGYAWAIGSATAGALWGGAAIMVFIPGDPGHQALLIVCLFGVILGGINLTSVYKPSFYGFVLPALLPLIGLVALQGDQVHAFIAAVMLVVLAFILGFGHNLNNLLTQSLAIRYENVDLIGELQAQTAAADDARAAAEAANRGKTQFLAAASHDLRQPLHALGLFAATLSAKVRDSELADTVASIGASVDALERLFSAMMDISKLDAGALLPARSAFPLGPMFSRLERAFAPLAAAGKLRLIVVPTEVWVDSDPVLLERIFANLLSNAIRYTEKGGAVLGVRRHGAHVAIDVCDSGIGIAAQERERIFDEFYRIDRARRGDTQGMGLGLAIIRRLAALLAHPVEVASTPGRGSRFRVVVARARASASIAPLDTAPFQRSPLADAVIAVIDDEVVVVDGMRAWFTQWGARVIGATSGDEILAALGEADSYPDLIVADYRLAGAERGTAVIARMREEFGVPVPALLVSGDATAVAVADMRQSGVEVLLKPVLPEELHTCVERLLVANRTHRACAPASIAWSAQPEKKAPQREAPGGQTEFGMTC